MSNLSSIDQLFGIIEDHVRAEPNAPALVTEGASIGYGVLWETVQAFRVALSSAGVERGARIFAPNLSAADGIAAFLACADLGATWCLASVAPEDTLWLRPTHRLVADTSAHKETRIDTLSDKDIQEFGSDNQIPGALVLAPSQSAPGVYGIALSAETILCRVEQLLKTPTSTGSTVALRVLPSFLPFWINSLAALAMRLAIRLDGNPYIWQEEGVDRFVGPLDWFLQPQFIKMPVERRISRIDSIHRPLNEPEVARLLEVAESIHLNFGTIESGTIWTNVISSGQNGIITKQATAPGLETALFNLSNAPVEDGQPGQLHVKGPSMADAFVLAPGPTPLPTQNGWLQTGYVAKEFPSIGLDVIGKPNIDRIAVDNIDIPAGILDAAIGTSFGVIDHVSFPHPDRSRQKPVTFAVFAEHVNRFQAVEWVKKSARDTLGDRFEPAMVWPVDRIPRLPDGTPDRRACQLAVRRAATSDPA